MLKKTSIPNIKYVIVLLSVSFFSLDSHQDCSTVRWSSVNTVNVLSEIEILKGYVT